MVKSKFKCVDITDFPQMEYKAVFLRPVTDGSEENKSFSKYTPSGSISINISYETEASNYFDKDKEYYVNFEIAD